MSGRLRLNLRLFWNVCAALIVATAIALASLRMMLPKLDRDRALVERWVSHWVGVPIEIDALGVTLTQGLPTVTARALRLFTPDAARAEVLRVNHAQASVGLWSSLRAGRIRLRDLAVSGLALTIVRQADGKFSVNGFAEGDSKFLDWLLAQKKLTVIDTDIRYIDERIPLPVLAAKGVALEIDARAGEIAIRGRATHIELIGAGVDFEVAITREGPRPTSLDLRLMGEQLDLAAVAEGLALKHPDLAIFRADTFVRYRDSTTGPGQLQFMLENVDLQRRDTAFSLRALSGQAIVSAEAVEVSIAKFDTAERAGPAVDWRARIDRDPSHRVRLSADRVPVSVLPWLAPWLPAQYASFNALMSRWSLAGELRELRLGLGSPYFYIAGQIEDFGLHGAEPRLDLVG
ncbi:MAG: hypothetical protein ACREXT_01375, partial [Gammaproteobacteria bacterium]